MEFKFKAETIHDLPIHKEFRFAAQCTSIRTNVTWIVCSVLLIWYIHHFDVALCVYLFLGIFACFLVSYLMQNSKKGDSSYRRLLEINQGQPRHAIHGFTEDGIHTTNVITGSQETIPYTLFAKLVETKNLFILMTKYRMCYILDKQNLEGGTPEEFAAFLLAHCPNIKKKRVSKPTLGKWIHRLFAAVLCIGTLIALLNLPFFNIWGKITGKIPPDMSYREISQELKPLGIHISEDTLENLEFYSSDSYGNTLNLLCYEGFGQFTEDTWEWTPSTSGVYWFDTEFFYLDSMYTDFLHGVSAMHEDLDFENIQEDCSDVDWDSGKGTVSISFDWNDEHYTMEANCYGDWFDMDVLYELMEIVQESECAGELAYTYDGGQGCLLFYGERSVIKKLAYKTGIDFTTVS